MTAVTLGPIRLVPRAIDHGLQALTLLDTLGTIDAHSSAKGGLCACRLQIKEHGAIEMPSRAVSPISRTRRLRAATLMMHGGASGLLRLAQPTHSTRLPSRSAIHDWAQRAATSLDSEIAALDSTPSEPFITPLLPSAALAWR